MYGSRIFTEEKSKICVQFLLTSADIRGKIIYGFVYSKTYREVKEKLWSIGRIQSSDGIKPEKMNFGELLYLWLEKKRPYHKHSTIDKYEFLIESHIIPELGEMSISKMSSKVICDFLANKLEKGRRDQRGGLAPSYVRSMMLIIRAALSYAAEEKMCHPLNPILFKMEDVRRPLDILNIQEQRSLEEYIEATENGVGIGILLSLYMGLRIGEVCALSWEDLDLENKVLYVRHTILRVRNPNRAFTDSPRTLLMLDEPKTKSSLRCIPIPNRLIAVLCKRRTHSVSNYVVSDQASFMSPRTYEYRFHRILEWAGVRSRNYHVLRHTFATRCVEAGVDVKTISEILGHANVTITLNTYVHSSMERKRIQIEKIADMLEKNKQSK